MFTRDMSLDQFKAVDPNNWATSALILDYLSIVGTSPESEIEEYLQFYSTMIKMYRIAALSYLLDAGFVTYSNKGFTLTEKGMHYEDF